MAIQWKILPWILNLAWIALTGWISVCFIIAGEIATTLNNPDFHIE